METIAEKMRRLTEERERIAAEEPQCATKRWQNLSE